MTRGDLAQAPESGLPVGVHTGRPHRDLQHPVIGDAALVAVAQQRLHDRLGPLGGDAGIVARGAADEGESGAELA